MATVRTPVNIAVTGDNRGAIVVGDNNTVVINQPAGAVVLPPEPVRTTRRDEPVRLGPRPFPDIVDRAEEGARLQAALTTVPPAPADVFGPPGIGKTALLRHVCGGAAAQAPFRDGVVYLDAARQGVDDVLQQLFQAFFETDRPFKPDETQLRKFLARTTPLVILDGSPWNADDLERMLNLAATATVAVSGANQVLLGQGCPIALRGLTPDDSLALMGHELGHPLEGADVVSGRTLAAALDGNPLNLLLVSAHARVFGVPIAQLAEGVRAAESPEAWLQELIASKLSERDRRALAAFAKVDCAPLDAAEVSAIGGDEAAPQELESLADRKLVSFDGTRYRVAAGVAAAIAAALLAMLPAEAAAQAFLQPGADPSTLVAHSDAVAGALKQAALGGKHAEAIALAHHAGDAVALAGRWDCWHTMLHHALGAAQTAHDTAGEAWALHQLGSRALALGDLATAQTSLQEAMHLRAGLGDPMAVAVTQHNLEMLHSPVAPSQQTSAPHAGWSAGAKIAAAVFGFVVVLGSVATWVAAKSGLPPFQPNPPVVAFTPSPHPGVAPIAHPKSPPVSHPVAPPVSHPARPPVANVGSTQLPHPASSTIAQAGAPQTSPPRRPPAPSQPPVQIVGRGGGGGVRYPGNGGGHGVHFPPRTEPPHTTITPTPQTIETAPPPVITYLSYVADKQCLAYSVLHADKAAIEPYASSVPLPSGCFGLKHLKQSATYTLIAYGHGKRSREVTVPGISTGGTSGGGGGRPLPPSIIDFVYRSDGSCLYYAVSNAEKATIAQIGSVKPSGGCAPVHQGEKPVTYTLVVISRGGRASSETTVPAHAPTYKSPGQSYGGSSYGTSTSGKSPYGTSTYGTSPYDAVPKTPVYKKPISATPMPYRTTMPYRTAMPYHTAMPYRTTPPPTEPMRMPP